MFGISNALSLRRGGWGLGGVGGGGGGGGGGRGALTKARAKQEVKSRGR